MNLSQAAGGPTIASFCNQFNGATLYLYSGSIPASPETNATGTQLYSFVFASPGFTTLTTGGGYDALIATFSGSGTYLASGTAGYGRVFYAASLARQNLTAYTRGTLIANSGSLYICTVGGITSNTNTLTANSYGILDGTAGFDYVGLSTATVIADYTVGTIGTDIVLGNTSIQSGVVVTITSFVQRVATV